MKKPQTNYAFIDGNNLHLGVADLGWVLDYRRFSVYLREHYGIARAYYFVERMPEYETYFTAFLHPPKYTSKTA